MTVAARTPRGVRRLHASTDIRAVFAARCAASSPVATVHARRRGDAGSPRATVVAGKAIGNAVQRNRAKRRLRALLPQLGLREGHDYVIVGRPAAVDAAPQTLLLTTRRLVDTVEDRCP